MERNTSRIYNQIIGLSRRFKKRSTYMVNKVADMLKEQWDMIRDPKKRSYQIFIATRPPSALEGHAPEPSCGALEQGSEALERGCRALGWGCEVLEEGLGPLRPGRVVGYPPRGSRGAAMLKEVVREIQRTAGNVTHT